MKKIIKSQINEDIKVITKPFDINTLACQIIEVGDRFPDKIEENNVLLNLDQ